MHPAPQAELASREASIERAQRDLERINRLLECEPFEDYFRRRLRERRARYAKDLENTQPESSTVQLRTRIAELDEILVLPETDRRSHTSTLAHLRG